MVRARGIIAIAATIALAACGEGSRHRDSPAPKDGEVKKYGTIDRADFAHPRIRRPDAVTIDGCCTIEAGSAKVSTPQSDAQLRIVEGTGYRAEVSFGFSEGDVDPAGHSTVQRTVDGVVLRRLSDPGRERPTWVAEVPVTAQATARGLVTPRLRIEGKCDSAASCRKLEEMIATIRF